MGPLSEADFRAALAFVRECEFASDLESYRETVIRVIDYVPGHITSYNEVDLENRKVVALLDPADVLSEESVATFERLAYQHPVISYVEETGDLAPRAISDFLSEDEFHRLELYREFFCDLDVEDQIAFSLPGARELILGVAINRSSRGFSDRDRAFLGLVAPHAGRAYVVARARSQIRAAMSEVDLRPAPNSAVIVLDRTGCAQALSPRAPALLETYFGEGIAPQGRLPARLADYVGAARESARGVLLEPAPAELTLSADGTRLRACLVNGAEPGEPDAVLLETEADRLSPGRIARLGLTGREGEVVTLIARSRTNSQIAAELRISPRTVQRHLENIFEKLGVRTRAGVIGRLLDS